MWSVVDLLRRLVVTTVVNCVSSKEIFWVGAFSRKLKCTRKAIHISQVVTSARVGFGK